MVTFTVREDLARRVADAASARGIPVDQAVIEALTVWTEYHTVELPELSFVGIGDGRADLAAHHDDVLVGRLVERLNPPGN